MCKRRTTFDFVLRAANSKKYSKADEGLPNVAIRRLFRKQFKRKEPSTPNKPNTKSAEPTKLLKCIAFIRSRHQTDCFLGKFDCFSFEFGDFEYSFASVKVAAFLNSNVLELSQNIRWVDVNKIKRAHFHSQIFSQELGAPQY